MNLLVIGSGGREHAIAKTFLKSPKVDHVYCAPGNPGMQKDGIQTVNIAETDHAALIQFAKDKQVHWTFVGPEVPLLNGIVDDFRNAGQLIFGPSKAAAFIEGSKSFAKQLMFDNNIPTAKSANFTNYEHAKAYISQMNAPIVVKADGLAAGKGVVVATTITEALEAAKSMLEEAKFGESGQTIVVEEFLEGEEFSLLAFVRGNEVFPMPISQDHKRAYDGDKGPNTGGMGAYCPVPHISEQDVQQAINEVLLPAAQGLVDMGRPFIGILYAGLILTNEGPKVIEFNARFGDPETQVVLPRLTSDFAQVIDDLLFEREVLLDWQKTGINLGVVVAAEGYPNNYQKGMPIPDFSSDDEVAVYFAGVSTSEDQLVGSGGRIYLVSASADTMNQAQKIVYQSLESKNTLDTFYRKDIGHRAI